jgi:lipopolysaccharide heptosyltransferase I
VKLLIVKTSSMGDVVCAMPAVTDAARALPGLEIDWIVEEAFAELPAMHRSVRAAIPVALRRWRRAPVASIGEARAFLRRLRARRYDRVLDSQGLLKSAAIALLARGPAAGFDWASAREPAAALAYGRRHAVPRDRHAIRRQRALFAASLGYGLPEGAPDYGLVAADAAPRGRYLVFAADTSWPSKRWPRSYWRALAERAAAESIGIRLPWEAEAQRLEAEALAGGLAGVEAIRTATLRELVALIAGARAVVAPDTGAAHLAAACGVPAVVLYGSTSPALTGTIGPGQRHLEAVFACSPCQARECRYRGPAETVPACYASLPPDAVWRALQQALAAR